MTSLLRAGLGDEEPAASGGRGPGHDALLTPGPRVRQGAVTREALESECVTEMLATSGMNKQGGTESTLPGHDESTRSISTRPRTPEPGSPQT